MEKLVDLKDRYAMIALLEKARESRDSVKGIGKAGFFLRQIAAVHGKGPNGGEQLAWDVAMQASGLSNSRLYVANCQAAAAGVRQMGPGQSMSHNSLVKGPPYPLVAPYPQNRPLALAAALRDSQRPLGTAITLDVHSAEMERHSMVWTSKLSLSFWGGLFMLPPGPNGKNDRNVILMHPNQQINLLSADVSEGVAMLDIGKGCNISKPDEARREFEEITHEVTLDDLEYASQNWFNVYLYIGSRSVRQCNEVDLVMGDSFTRIGYEEARALGLPFDARRLNWDPKQTGDDSLREFVVPTNGRHGDDTMRLLDKADTKLLSLHQGTGIINSSYIYGSQ